MSWRPRAVPLDPVGLTVAGEPALRLARRLLERPRELFGVQVGNRLVLLGDDLPWVDGVLYLGRADGGVLVPTHLEPPWPAEWLSATLAARCAPPWAVLPGLAIGLSRASRIENQVLEEFLRAHAAR